MLEKITKNRKGSAVIEVLLLVVILIALVLIFKEHIIAIVESLFGILLETPHNN